TEAEQRYLRVFNDALFLPKLRDGRVPRPRGQTMVDVVNAIGSGSNVPQKIRDLIAKDLNGRKPRMRGGAPPTEEHEADDNAGEGGSNVAPPLPDTLPDDEVEIGRASCRERGGYCEVGVGVEE